MRIVPPPHLFASLDSVLNAFRTANAIVTRNVSVPRCEPLGAESVAQTFNAHGTWSGTPGTTEYSYGGMCEVDNDCPFSFICNPLTSGCIPAADFNSPCSGSSTCPEGPNGEVLVCDAALNLCLPAPLCRSDVNCCGGETFTCDTGASVCRPPLSDCTPPAAVTAECPFEPKEQAECLDGRFCSPQGACVQCLCNADCNPNNDNGLSCNVATGLCQSDDFCDGPEDCPEGQSCDTQANRCHPVCPPEGCPAGEFCDEDDNICRSNANRPCVPDTFEPNNSLEAAVTQRLCFAAARPRSDHPDRGPVSLR